MAHKYNPQEIEKRWQEKWAIDRIYEVKEGDNRPEFYCLTMFPYTSGDLHIGHWYAMAPSDVYARFKRMQGYNVLHPMGFDAFGLPAENAAISRGIHPYEWTMNNIEKMRHQLKSMGAIYDWNREVITCLPEYYKWTQWFFLKLYHAGLAYRAKAPVNWCPKCQTVLANEQVVGEGSCERCGTTVTKKDLEQWFFRITKYAEELLDFSGINWPERIKIMQKNWIGKSDGAEIFFALEHEGLEQKEIRVFTTRPDTIFGVTFFLLSPEHPLVGQLTTPEQKAEVAEYVAWCRRQPEYMRTALGRDKTGVFLGSYVINRLNRERVPVWITDYVLPTYGTGAVMGVPAHDERDFDFAQKFHLPIRPVIVPPDWSGGELTQAYAELGIMINSGQFTGLSSEQGYEAICDLLEEKGWGRRTVSYRLRDWLISRQRYWGAPIPLVYCDKCGIVPVPEKDLPVLLPPDAEFKPTGESPLKYCPSFVNTTCPKCSGPAQRETDTMDTFMCSSWYFLRYTSPKTDEAPFDTEKVKYWLPVDLYTGGAEHAVMHLFYARFFIKALRDMGLVDFGEPFTHLFNQGTIIYRGAKMSKSKGNVVAPDEYVAELGADAVRGYLMFIGPWELGGEWSDNGIVGISRWLNKAWGLVEKQYASRAVEPETEKELRHFIHKTIKKVTEDLERFRFNTMLASLMEFTNYLSEVDIARNVSIPLWQEAISCFLLLLAPTAPHLAEELWIRTGHPYSIHNESWPNFDEELVKEEQITLPIQINGKLRDKVVVSASVSEAEVKELVLARERVKAYTDGRKILNIIYVPKRVVSIVAR
ncbi:MAG: leucine--tRNA ligase [Chloroflexi bacterium CG_4_9_14_3_um_filter_45_9]|nr:MAG: leucine--tRNA ligase [Chloroflexi bacterium CG_4_9_14_3_um_filter_45_9]